MIEVYPETSTNKLSLVDSEEHTAEIGMMDKM
jgi:hypothetical protein